MRYVVLLLALCSTLLHAADESWLLTVDRWGTPEHEVLELARDGARLGGRLGRDAIVGTRRSGRLQFEATDAQRGQRRFDGQQRADEIRGEADYADPNRADARVRHAFVARRLPQRPSGPSRTHVFAPTDYSNTFSAERRPVLTIWPGDSVRTKTIDSGGVDEHGNTVALYGNPQTGPFYVAGAEPGDTLVVHLVRLRPNRDYADSLDGIVPRALNARQAAAAATLGQPVRWTLDRDNGIARTTANGALAGFTVPLQPMLGGIAVAPGAGSPPMSTGDTGRNGGNMDFNAITEGSTVYLPVSQPGALLYLGDAHAAQGDGETSQYALETSMDVEFTVEVQRGRTIGLPRIESRGRVHVLGQAGSLDEALRAATDGLLRWLQQEHVLELADAAQILGSSVQYRVANLAGRSVGLAASLDVESLRGLARRSDVAAPR